MLVNSNFELRRSASLGLFLCRMAMLFALAGGLLTIVGNLDTRVGQTMFLIRYDEQYLPGYAVQARALSYFAFAYALWRLTTFFRLSRTGQLFSADTTTHLRAFGRWLLIAAIAAAVLPLLAIAIHQFVLVQPDARNVPPIRVPLFSSVFVIAIASLVMTICRIVDEGRRLHNELEEIV